jgi:alpha,alpha-trehalose phosphorylase
MLHRKRLKPPPHHYPPDEWNLIEKGFHPEFLAQPKTIFALSNGYLGMRGCPEEGGPNAENSTFINGFMKNGRSYTQKRPSAWPKPVKQSPM